MKARFPELAISLNGGISSLREAEDHLRNGLDGVMIGRAAYHDPALLGSADREIFGVNAATVTPETAIEAMLPYIQAERAAGTPLHAITRHMLGAFRARPGARAWRRTLSQEALRPGAGVEVVQAALRLVAPVEKAAPEQCVSVPA